MTFAEYKVRLASLAWASAKALARELRRMPPDAACINSAIEFCERWKDLVLALPEGADADFQRNLLRQSMAAVKSWRAWKRLKFQASRAALTHRTDADTASEEAAPRTE